MQRIIHAVMLVTAFGMTACTGPQSTDNEAATQEGRPLSTGNSPADGSNAPAASDPSVTPSEAAIGASSPAGTAGNSVHTDGLASPPDTSGTDHAGMGHDSGDGANGTSTAAHVGWYRLQDGQGLFQPCGSEQTLKVAASSALEQKAESFGLQPDTPVYVKLEGTRNGESLAVTGVSQFGSPTPVRNCAMNGVVTQGG